MPKLLVLCVAVLLAWPSWCVAQGLTPLRAAFIADNPVQGKVDAQTGTVSGIAADLVAELARRWARPFEVLPVPNAGTVIERLAAGDIEVGFLAYESARAKQVAYSDPYVLSGSNYLVRADSDFKKSEDLDRAGVTIGTVAGQSQQIHVSEHIKRAKVEILPSAPAPAAMAKLLLSGQLDAFAANRQRLDDAMRQASGLRILPDSFMFAAQSLVVAPANRSRLGEINQFLAELRASGRLEAIVDRAGVAGVEVAPATK